MSGLHVAALDAVETASERLSESTWGSRVLRAGLAARGAVFLVLGYLVARIAMGALGEPATSSPASLPGVADALAGQPGGHPIIFGLGIGLAAYALFSAVDAVLHHDEEVPAAKRWGDRGLSAFGFVMYAAFSAYCFQAALSSGTPTSSARNKRENTQWSAQVLRWPLGWLWLALLATVMLVIAGFLASRAWRRSFRPRLDKGEIGPRTWRIAVPLGVVGNLGRAVLFAVVGGCIMSAAVENDPRHGQGADGSLRILAASPWGPLLLWPLAASLISYGVYMIFETRYRHV